MYISENDKGLTIDDKAKITEMKKEIESMMTKSGDDLLLWEDLYSISCRLENLS